jgi:hypothetical protein
MQKKKSMEGGRVKKENTEAKKEEIKEKFERRKYFPQNFSIQWQNNVKEKLSLGLINRDAVRNYGGMEI